jgi:hypothetical protein
VVVASKLHKLVSSYYSCSFALTPYDLDVINNVLKKCNEKKKKKLEHDKKKKKKT